MSLLTKIDELWVGFWGSRPAGALALTPSERVQEILAPMEFEMSLEREDRPKFKRTYKATIPGGFRIEFTFYFDMFGGRSDRSATLTQSNGNYIFFDPHRVAEKIIDRDLAPKVQLLSEKVLRLDRQFAHNPPTEFVDKTGAKWIRADRIRAIAA